MHQQQEYELLCVSTIISKVPSSTIVAVLKLNVIEYITLHVATLGLLVWQQTLHKPQNQHPVLMREFGVTLSNIAHNFAL